MTVQKKLEWLIKASKKKTRPITRVAYKWSLFTRPTKPKQSQRMQSGSEGKRGSNKAK